MDTVPSAHSITSTLLGQIVSLVPGELRQLIEGETEAISLSAARLGLEVLDAEQRNIGFTFAVERSAEFPLLGRVYFGAVNLLQWQVPPVVRETLRTFFDHALGGQFNSTRKLFFLIAQRKNDPEAALCRFLLWSAVRINLLILTWHQPQVEASGVLDDMERRTEHILTQLLNVDDIHEPDFRPLHVLIAKVLEDTCAAAAPLLMGAMTELEAEFGDALRLVRGLNASDAAIFHPGRFTGPPGSQQILDRFPQHHFESTNAIEQRRARIRKRGNDVHPSSDRFIDLILSADRSRD